MKPQFGPRLGVFIHTKRGSRSHEAYGQTIGHSGSTVHRLEAGTQNFTRDLLEGLAVRYHCDIAGLFPPLPEKPA